LIYFVDALDLKMVKIGYASEDPDGRLAIMQTGSPVKLTRRALMEGDRHVERELHQRFKKLRVHGEWFRDDITIVRFLVKNAVNWIGPVIPGTIISQQFREEWMNMRAYCKGIPSAQADLQEEWPTLDGERLFVD
jgi:hypothetical protein